MKRELIAIEEELQSRKRNGEEGDRAKEADNLTNGEIARYSRQLLLPEFGVRAQRRLKLSSALIVGAGGLGCPCAQYLVAAGVGRVGIVDHDCVDKSNLHRQVVLNYVTTCVFNLASSMFARIFVLCLCFILD